MGEALSYEVTCQVVTLIIENTKFGKREKVLDLNKEIYVIKLGSFLLFKTRENDKLDKDGVENSNRRNAEKNEDMKVMKTEDEKNKISLKGINVMFPEVCDKQCF